MGYQSIAVHVDDAPACARRLAVAATLARRFGAALIGVYVVPTRELVPSVTAVLPDDVVAQRLAETGWAQNEAEARFHAAAAGAGLIDVEWRAPAGEPIAAAAAHARGADLAVVGQRDPDDGHAAFAEALVHAVVMTSGRPTLIVPYVGEMPTLGETVLVAWKDARESARAVADALPLLAVAQKVVLVGVGAGGEDSAAAAQAEERIVANLRHHGVHATTRRCEGEDVGAMLLSQAFDVDADLIVMGAYSRPRLQELVLGGATRGVLEAMTVPVLMSH